MPSRSTGATAALPKFPKHICKRMTASRAEKSHALLESGCNVVEAVGRRAVVVPVNRLQLLVDLKRFRQHTRADVAHQVAAAHVHRRKYTAGGHLSNMVLLDTTRDSKESSEGLGSGSGTAVVAVVVDFYIASSSASNALLVHMRRKKMSFPRRSEAVGTPSRDPGFRSEFLPNGCHFV